MLQMLELLEQHTVSQIRAMKGLLLASQDEAAITPPAPTKVQAALATKELEERLGEWLADNTGINTEGADGIERIRESKTTES